MVGLRSRFLVGVWLFSISGGVLLGCHSHKSPTIFRSTGRCYCRVFRNLVVLFGVIRAP